MRKNTTVNCGNIPVHIFAYTCALLYSVRSFLAVRIVHDTPLWLVGNTNKLCSCFFFLFHGFEVVLRYAIRNLRTLGPVLQCRNASRRGFAGKVSPAYPYCAAGEKECQPEGSLQPLYRKMSFDVVEPPLVTLFPVLRG